MGNCNFKAETEKDNVQGKFTPLKADFNLISPTKFISLCPPKPWLRFYRSVRPD